MPVRATARLPRLKVRLARAGRRRLRAGVRARAIGRVSLLPWLLAPAPASSFTPWPLRVRPLLWLAATIDGARRCRWRRRRGPRGRRSAPPTAASASRPVASRPLLDSFELILERSPCSAHAVRRSLRRPGLGHPNKSTLTKSELGRPNVAGSQPGDVQGGAAVVRGEARVGAPDLGQALGAEHLARRPRLATVRPSETTTTVSAIAAARARSWTTSSTARPSSTRSRSRPATPIVAPRSSWEVGSSAISTGASWASPIAIWTRCSSPPESVVSVALGEAADPGPLHRALDRRRGRRRSAAAAAAGGRSGRSSPLRAR